MKNLLVFPINSFYLKLILSNNLDTNQKVIGASSNLQDRIEWNFNSLELLPPISSNRFIEELRRLIQKHEITHVLSLHPLVRLYLSKNLFEINPTVVLEATRIEDILQEKLERWIKLQSRPALLELKKTCVAVSHISIAGVIARAQEVYGETPQEKIDELLKIFPSLPPGDVVEIGVFFGKSAIILAEFSYIFKVGSVLLVDPWDYENSIQSDKQNLLQKLSLGWDWNFIYQSFLMNISMNATHKNFNYIRNISTLAVHTYLKSHSLTTPEFGQVRYTGKISLLHIDGNHNYEEVKKDIENWIPLVSNNGWVVFDDYIWEMGDGVKKAVDEFCEQNTELVAECNQIGRSLFIRIHDNND